MIPAVVRFTVYGQAQPKGSARAFMPKGARFPVVTSDNPSLKGWERVVRDTLQTGMRRWSKEDLAALFEAPVRVVLDFHLPRPKSLPKRVTAHTRKPDLDKLARGTIDALSGVLFKDDAQVVEIRARKVHAEGSALVHIRVERAW